MNALRKRQNASATVGHRMGRPPLVAPAAARAHHLRTRSNVRGLRLLVVTAGLRMSMNARCAGRLIAGSQVLRCALGASGIVHRKREGDRGTPAGRWPLLSGFYRPDRTSRPHALLPFLALRPHQGWCDDPAATLYNKAIVLPSRHRHEKLWRGDRLYDVMLILDYNMKPCRKGRGSAIFFHLADGGFAATAGCVAISRDDMRRLLPRLGRHAALIVR